MKLITKAQRDKLIANHKQQDGTKTFDAVVKLFTPDGCGTWYLSELDPETNIAFGLCCLHEKEFGYVSMDELSSVRGALGLKVERDRWFKPMSLEECEAQASSDKQQAIDETVPYNDIEEATCA